MAANPTRAYRFSGYQLDLAQQRLSGADGQSIALPGRAYDVLVFLIEHRERVVSKDELLKAVWPRTIVEENNLNQAVSTLRRALGDSRETPRCILTVAGRGYRFIADATEVRSPPRDRAAGADNVRVRNASSVIDAGIAGDGACRRVAAATSPPEAAGAGADAGSPLAPRGRGNARVGRRRCAAAGAPTFAGGVRSCRVRSPCCHSSRWHKAPPNEAVELGVAETLINRLSELPGVVVSPLSSVRRFGGVEQDPLEAGRTLHVDAVVDGYIQIQQDNVRLTARLLDVGDGTALWAGRFDEPLADFFRLQDSLASQLVGALAIQLTGPAKARLLRRDTDDVEAWQLYVNGRYHFDRRNEENLRRAIGFYEAAERRDPALCARGRRAGRRLGGARRLQHRTAAMRPSPRRARRRSAPSRSTTRSPKRTLRSDTSACSTTATGMRDSVSMRARWRSSRTTPRP